ncbi:MAG: hypothetical protein HFE45_12635 [Oscillospiraceae bacterium]|jgi:hypothetical protein|nr:hypothetical protein [Oscillospiraceae bacterium]
MKINFRSGAAMLCLFLFMGLGAPKVYAEDFEPEISVQDITENTTWEGGESYVPMDIQIGTEDDFKLLKKVFVVDEDVSPSVLIEPNLTRLGCSYEYLETLKEELPGESETKTVQKNVVIESDTKDLTVLAAAQEPTLPYDENGFAGELVLDEAGITVQDGEKQSYSYTVTDTKTYAGLAAQDPYLVPKEVSKNGITLTLSDIQWVPAGVQADGSGLPASYTAIVSYAGRGWGSKTASCKVTFPYSGEVTRKTAGQVKYTLVYGEVKPVQMTEENPIEMAETPSKHSSAFWLTLSGGGLLTAAAVLAAWKGWRKRI